MVISIIKVSLNMVKLLHKLHNWDENLKKYVHLVYKTIFVTSIGNMEITRAPAFLASSHIWLFYIYFPSLSLLFSVLSTQLLIRSCCSHSGIDSSMLGIVLHRVRKPITHGDWPSNCTSVCGSIPMNNWVMFTIPFTCIHTLWYKPREYIVFLCGHYLRYKIENKLVNDRKEHSLTH